MELKVRQTDTSAIGQVAILRHGKSLSVQTEAKLFGNGNRLTAQPKFFGVEWLCQQRALANKKNVAGRRANGRRIRGEENPLLCIHRIERASKDLVGRIGVKKVPIIRKEGRILVACLTRLERGYRNGLATCRRHTFERTSGFRCKHDHPSPVPASPSAARSITDGQRWSAFDVHPLQLCLSKERDRAAVRGPEWQGGVFGSHEGLCGERVQSANPEHGLTRLVGGERELAAVGGYPSCAVYRDPGDT